VPARGREVQHGRGRPGSSQGLRELVDADADAGLGKGGKAETQAGRRRVLQAVGRQRRNRQAGGGARGRAAASGQSACPARGSARRRGCRRRNTARADATPSAAFGRLEQINQPLAGPPETRLAFDFDDGDRPTVLSIQRHHALEPHRLPLRSAIFALTCEQVMPGGGLRNLVIMRIASCTTACRCLRQRPHPPGQRQ